jgi:hypothetical protein
MATDKITLAALAALAYFLYSRKAGATEVQQQPVTNGIPGTSEFPSLFIPVNPVVEDIDVPLPYEDVIIKPGMGYDVPSVDAIIAVPAVEPEATVDIPVAEPEAEVNIPVIDPVFTIPTTTPTTSPTVVTKPVEKPGEVVTQEHPTGILYMLDPNLIKTILPLTLLYTDSLSLSYQSSKYRFYTKYDILGPAPDFKSLTLLSSIVNIDLTPIVSYYYNLIKEQMSLYETRKAYVQSLSYTDANIREFDILNLVIDSYDYKTSIINDKYRSITSVSIPRNVTPSENVAIIDTTVKKTEEAIVTKQNVLNLTTKPGSYIGPFYVPNDGVDHEYAILNKDYTYHTGDIFGLTYQVEGVVAEFNFNTLFNSFKSLDLVDIFEYATKVFLATFSKKTGYEISSIQGMSYKSIGKRLLYAPNIEYVYAFLKYFNDSLDVIDIDTVKFAKSYNIPINDAVKFIKGYEAYKIQVSNPNLTHLDYYEQKLLHTNIDQYKKDTTAYTNQLNYLMSKDLRTQSFGEKYSPPVIPNTGFGSYRMKFGNAYTTKYGNDRLFNLSYRR